MTTPQTPSPSSDGRKPQIQLQDRYGRIAISAVLAALPYGKDSKSQSDENSDSRN